MPKQIQVTIALKIPQVPNFLRTSDGDDANTFDVADVTDEGLRQIGAEWTEALVENARKRRKIGKAAIARTAGTR